MFLTAALALATVVSMSAQLSVNAGFGFFTETEKATDGSTTTTETDPFNSFGIGVKYEIPVAGCFSVMPGAGLYYQFSKEEGSLASYTATSKNKAFGIDIPVLAKATFDVGPVRLFAVAGPYLDLCLMEKTVVSDNQGNETTYNYFEDSEDWKRLGWGLQFGVGVDFLDNYRLMYNYQLGLTNWCKQENYSDKSSGSIISVAYLF